MNAIDRDRMRVLQAGLVACQELIIRINQVTIHINQEIHDILLRTETKAAPQAEGGGTQHGDN